MRLRLPVARLPEPDQEESLMGPLHRFRLGDAAEMGAEPEEIVRYWCERYGIPYLGRAAIGHSSANRIVPFGLEA